jgi:hypothetical protein
VAIDVDTSEAPALLRFKVTGKVPSAEEQDTLREDLIARGLLTEDSVSLLDFRELDAPDAITLGKSIAAAVKAGMPRRRAFLINPGRHLSSLQYFQKAVPWMSAAAFINEHEAIEWLLNPEGRAGFSR